MNNNHHYEPGIEFAQHLDDEDTLVGFRSKFCIPNPDLLYMDGNSLGRPTTQTIYQVEAALKEQWAGGLIRSWGTDWYAAPVRIGEKIAKLVGAGEGQVIVSDSTSVNLFKLVMAALDIQAGRHEIVSDVLNFPSDLYILQGCIRLLDRQYKLHPAPSGDSISIDLGTLYESINDQTALVTLSHVTFKSGFLYDAKEVTRKAHEVGALMLWDLSHSVGAVPVELDEWGVDLAVGCTYKYLNGGPGSPAFIYVRRDLQEEMLSPIWGWFGEHSPFAFDLDYLPAEGISRFLCGTPPVLSLLALEPAVDLIIEAGIEHIRTKSVGLTSYMIYLFEQFLAPLGFELGTPHESDHRGSHVSVRHTDGYRINRALIEEMKVLPDFREPDNIRLGLSPLYTSYSEIWEAVSRIQQVVMEERFLKYSDTRSAVT
jgi:kynureninase